MELLTILFALMIPSLTGDLLVSAVLGEDATVFEKVFFGYGAGLGVLSYEMFILGLLRVPFTALLITAVQIVIIAVLVVLRFRTKAGGRKAPMERSGISRAALVLAALLSVWVLVKLGFVFHESVTRPIYSWDTWANWSAGAKLFFYGHGLILDKTSENFFGSGYRPFLGHPLHSVLLQVYSALWLGGFHETYVKLWTFFYFVSMLGIMYFAIKREAGLFYGVAGVFFLSSLPLLTYHAQDAYSDFPLGWYSFAAAVSFWRYMRSDNRRFLIISGAFLGMGMFVKNEGLFFLAAIGAALLLYSILERKPLITNLLYLALPALLLAGPWLVFKTVNHFGFGHTGSGLKWLGDPNIQGGAKTGVHWDIIVPAFKEVFLTANFSLLFPFWIVISVIGLRSVARSEIKYLDLVVFIVMTGFVFVYLTLERMSVLEATGIHRNILTYAPIMLFSSALTLNGVMQRWRG
ncbi:MAG: glycosyltransferase family 39 protein [Deltaproteobacteria bacterium]|nr:glycosyltransferase family 39 protein [Deltaproteobacteria bacterium]